MPIHSQVLGKRSMVLQPHKRQNRAFSFIFVRLFCSGTVIATLPATLENPAAIFDVRIFKENPSTGMLEAVRERLGLRQSDFPYVVTGLEPGLYLARVDQQLPDGQISSIQQQNPVVDGMLSMWNNVGVSKQLWFLPVWRKKGDKKHACFQF